jgi:hypothetical protein
MFAIRQPKRNEINVLEKLSNGEQVDQTIAFFAARGFVPESLDVQQMRDEVRRVRFHDREDDHREKHVARDRDSLFGRFGIIGAVAAWRRWCFFWWL